MATFGDLVVRLSLDKRPFDRGATGVQSSLSKFAKVGGQVAAAYTAVAGAVTAAGLAFAEFVKPSFEAIENLANVADRLGITTEALAGLQHAAKLSNIETEALTASLQKMQVNLSDAALGGGTAAKAFEELGLKAAQLKNLSVDDQFVAIADALQRIPNVADRLRIVTDIFGRGGAPLLNMLMEGGDGLRAMADEADRLGQAISGLDARKIMEANDAWDRMGVATKGLANTLAIEVAPAVEAIATGFTNLTATGLPAIGKLTAAINNGLIPALHVAGGLFGPLGIFGTDVAAAGLDAARRPADSKGGLKDKTRTGKLEKAIAGETAPDAPIGAGIPSIAPVADAIASGISAAIKTAPGSALGTTLTPRGPADDQLAGGALKGSNEALSRILRAGQRQKDPSVKVQEKTLTEIRGLRKDLAAGRGAGGLVLGDDI